MAYNPKKDVVAGKTASQIDAAKRRAVKGKGKKKCKKGKSCGATCINGSKVCMVDLPRVSAQGLGKVAGKIQERPKVNPSYKPTFNLPPLSTSEEFNDKVDATLSVADNPKLNRDSITVARVLGVKNGSFPYMQLYKDDGDETTDYLAVRKKEGLTKVADGVNALYSYTGAFDSAKGIRDADRGKPNPDLPEYKVERYKQQSEDLNALLTMPSLPKTEVEKFRGFRSTPENLAQMVEGVRNKESFTHVTTYSWTSSLGEGRRFANRKIYELPERTERVIFRTINKRGVPIEFVTAVPGESEILTPRGTKYSYLDYRTIEMNGKTYHVFDVEEFS